MKKIAIIFSFVIILIIAIVEFVIIITKNANDNVSYGIVTEFYKSRDVPIGVVTYDWDNIPRDILYYDQEEIDYFLNSGNGQNISFDEAAKLAHMHVFSHYPQYKFIKPYSIYYDEENSVYTVIAESFKEDCIYKVVVCKKTRVFYMFFG